MGIPYGGAKGGIKCNVQNFSSNELERLSRGYVRAVNQIVGPLKDIPAPDLFTNPQIMAWMLDEYNIIHQYNNPGFITGKPIALGGLSARHTSTAKGVATVAKEAMKLREVPLVGAKVIIQGFGNAGSFLAKTLYDCGVKIIGVSDVNGALYDPDGLIIDYLLEKRNNNGNITALFDNRISNAELLVKECDVLIPAAVENQITEQNAHEIKAKIVVEAANSPTTREASEILSNKNILVVPDVIANSGGVIVSYFEWVQNNSGYYWDENEIITKMNNKLLNSFYNVYETSKKLNIDMHLAAYVIGLKKMVQAIKVRGWV